MERYVLFFTSSFSFCAGNATTICFLFRQLCKSSQNKNIEHWNSLTSMQLWAKAVISDARKNRVKIHICICVEVSFKKVKAYNFIKNVLQHICFSVNFAKYLGTLLSKYKSRQLVLCGLHFKKVSFFFGVCFKTLFLVLNTQ